MSCCYWQFAVKTSSTEDKTADHHLFIILNVARSCCSIPTLGPQNTIQVLYSVEKINNAHKAYLEYRNDLILESIVSLVFELLTYMIRKVKCDTASIDDSFCLLSTEKVSVQPGHFENALTSTIAAMSPQHFPGFIVEAPVCRGVHYQPVKSIHPLSD